MNQGLEGPQKRVSVTRVILFICTITIAAFVLISLFFPVAITNWRENPMEKMTVKDVVILTEGNMVNGPLSIGMNENMVVSLRKPYQKYAFQIQFKKEGGNWEIIRPFSTAPATIDMSAYAGQKSIDIQVDVCVAKDVGDSVNNVREIYMGNLYLKQNTSPIMFPFSLDAKSNNIAHGVTIFFFLVLGLLIVVPMKKYLSLPGVLCLAPFASCVFITTFMLLLYIVGILNPIVFFVLLGLLTVGALFLIIRSKPNFSKKEVGVLLVYISGAIVLAIVLPANNIVSTSYDSFTYYLYGQFIAQTGALYPSSLNWSISLGSTLPLLYVFGNFFGADFFHGVHFVLLLFFLLFVVWFCATETIGSKPRKIGCAAFVGAGILSCYFVPFLGLFALSNGVSFYFFLIFSLSMYKMTSTQKIEWFYIAFFANLAYAFTRTETLIFSGVFLFLLCCKQINSRHNVVVVAVHSFLVILWLQRLLLVKPFPPSEFITPSRGFFISAIYVLFTVFCLVVCYFPKLKVVQNTNIILLGSVLAVLLSVFVFWQSWVNNGPMILFNMLQNGGYWGITWVAILLLYLMLWGKPSYAWRKDILAPVVVYTALLLLVFCFRETPLREGWGDSANRMLMTLVPLLIIDLAFLIFGKKTNVKNVVDQKTNKKRV